jgi:pilus assembly protein CpaE
MPARILVIVDDPSLQRLLTDALVRAGNEVIDAARGDLGLARWEEDRPDLVVVDVALPGIDGFGVVQHIRASEGPAAHVPVIMLGAATDASAKIRGLRAGADSFQTKPVHTAEFIARTRSLLMRFGVRVRSVATRSTRGQVHAYYGAKGGVGTTTIAINTAIAMHRIAKQRVVLVDGNLQFGDHRVFLDLGPDLRSIVDVVTSSAIDSELMKSLVVHHDTGIDLLLAPASPEDAEHVSADRHHLAHAVETLRTMYDVVIVDLDKHLGEHSLDVMSLADTVFVVMTADLSCIKNVRLVLHAMNQIGLPGDKVQLIMNRSNAFTGISVKSVEAVLDRPVDHQIVNDYRAAISALNSGSPIIAARPDTLMGRSIISFVRAIEDQHEPAPQIRDRQLIPALT